MSETKTKLCSNKGCGEHPIENFSLVNGGRIRAAKCNKCLAEYKKENAKSHHKKSKKRTVGKTDGGLANEFTMMRW